MDRQERVERVLSNRDWIERLLNDDCVLNPCSSSVGYSTGAVRRPNRGSDRRARRQRLLSLAKESSSKLTAEQTGTESAPSSGVLPTNRTPIKHATHFVSELENAVTQNANLNNRRFFGGFDGGFTVGFYGKWSDTGEQWLERCKYLDGLKEKSQTAKEQGRVLPSIPMGGEDWHVLPHGTGTGVKYRWVLSRGGARVAIHSNPKGNIAPVSVTLGYEAIANKELDKVLAHIETALESIGFTVERDLVSRCDIQITFKLSFDVVAQTYQEDRFVNRLRKASTHSGVNGLETLTWGGGSNRKLEVCIYDKTQELLDNVASCGKKLEDLEDFFGSSEALAHLTRVEFRMFRDWLRERNIDSYFDLLDALPSLVGYLTFDYFRALAEPKKEGHELGQEMASWWCDVRAGFLQVFGDGFKPTITPRVRRASCISFMELCKQGIGCMSSAFSTMPASKENENKMTYPEFKVAFVKAIVGYMPEAYKDYCRKREQFLSTLEPLDLSEVTDNIERRLKAREARQARRASMSSDGENELDCFGGF